MQNSTPTPQVNSYLVGTVAGYRAKVASRQEAAHRSRDLYATLREVMPWPTPDGTPRLSRTEVEEINTGVVHALLSKGASKSTRVLSMSELVGREVISMREALGFPRA
jgi:hypothetical protein